MNKIVFLLIIALVVGGAYIYYVKTTTTPFLSSGEDVVVTIEPGQSVVNIADTLETKGIIGSASMFKLYVKRSEKQADIKAGTYVLNPAFSIREIVDHLVAGAANDRERTITTIEGWSISDIDDYLSNNGVFSVGDFSSLAGTPIGKWPFEFPLPVFLAKVPDKADLEGYLFPDTYRIFNDATVDDVVKRMLDNLGAKLTDEMLKDIDGQGKSLHEIITMASIIEREVFGDEDRRIVSGILNTRLSIGMALQVDSTINYITGKNDPSATYADLEIDSPYNTYKYRGLPPGPISNPGISAIMAAIYPTDSDYLYYLNRQDTGETIFSRTLDEHNLNKHKYLK